MITYAIAVAIAMVVFVAIIYGICRLLKLDIKLRPLILVAVLGVALSLWLVFNNTALDYFFFLQLGGGVLGVGLIATLYSRRLARADELTEVDTSALADTADVMGTAVATASISEEIPVKVASTLAVADTAGTMDSVADITNNTEPTKTPLATDAVFNSDLIATNSTDIIGAGTLTMVEGSADYRLLPTEKLMPSPELPLAEDNNNIAVTATASLDRAITVDEVAVAVNGDIATAPDLVNVSASAVSSLEPAAQAITDGTSTGITTAGTFEELTSAPYEPSIDDLPTTLDDLLDYAHEHRGTSPAKAILALREAIATYGDDAYAPFMVIELTNIYRNRGEYKLALDALSNAQYLPSVQGDINISKEFARITTYLTIIYDILMKHECPHMPYLDISADILAEIEQAMSDHG